MSAIMNFKDNIDLSDYTLIIPSVSVGNVPQLTVDLIVKTFDLNKSATLWHPAIVPSVGSDPYNSDPAEICTACELYSNKSRKLAVIQIRSSLEVNLVLKFFEDLCSALSSLNLRNIVILSSAFDYEMKNVNMAKFYYISNDYSNEIMDMNQVKCLEKNINNRYVVNGGGFGTKLYEVLSLKFKCTLLGKYVSEGDNRHDAISMLQKFFNIVGIHFNVSDILLPSSWQYVFGGPPPIGIY